MKQKVDHINLGKEKNKVGRSMYKGCAVDDILGLRIDISLKNMLDHMCITNKELVL